MDVLHDITAAEPMPGFKVHVTFDTGETGVFDCSAYLGHPYWKRLNDPAFFRLVHVCYGTLAWPDEIDIAPEDVWEKTIRDTNGDMRYPPIQESGAVSAAESPASPYQAQI